MDNKEKLKREFGNTISDRIEEFRRYFDKDPERIKVSQSKANMLFDNPNLVWAFTIKIEPVPDLDYDFVLSDADNEKKVFSNGEFDGVK
jgi:hypothetical protein